MGDETQGDEPTPMTRADVDEWVALTWRLMTRHGSVHRHVLGDEWDAPKDDGRWWRASDDQPNG